VVAEENCDYIYKKKTLLLTPNYEGHFIEYLSVKAPKAKSKNDVNYIFKNK